MHPGFYYAAAATCAEKRRARFLEVLVVAEGADGESAPAPGFANEKKSDHLGTILEVCRFLWGTIGVSLNKPYYV